MEVIDHEDLWTTIIVLSSVALFIVLVECRFGVVRQLQGVLWWFCFILILLLIIAIIVISIVAKNEYNNVEGMMKDALIDRIGLNKGQG